MIPAVRYLKNADSPVLREKPIFSPRNASVSEWTLPRILKIKISRDTRQFRRNFFYSENASSTTLSSSIILFFLLSFFSRYLFLFLLTISRPPPGIYLDKKSPSHICGKAFRDSSTLLLCKSLGIDPVDEARKGNRVPNMFQLADPGYNPLQSHPES